LQHATLSINPTFKWFK